MSAAPSFLKALADRYAHQLDQVRTELDQFDDDAALWRERPGITNTAGTLVLHICGNLRHFVGSVLGGTGYIRDRPAEFGDRNLLRAELYSLLERTRQEITETLLRMDPARLTARYPLDVLGREWTVAEWLIHLLSHLSYHLGQVNYFWRIS